MLIRATCVFAPAAAMFLALPLAAQSWGPVGSAPAVAFGTGGDLLARDAQGLVGFDEVAGNTLLPQGTGWIALPASPSPRQHAALAGAGSFVYLFGGSSTSGPLGDLWRFERATNNWIQRPPATPAAPSPRQGARAASIAGAAPLLLFGGLSASGWPNDTWTMFDGGAAFWAQVPTPAGLVGRTGHAMAAGPALSIVLFGGQQLQPLGDTWVFRGATWTQHLGTSPPAAAGCRMVYDAGRDMTVLVHPNGETWEWNDYAWRRVGVTASPAWSSPALIVEPPQNGLVRALQVQGASLLTWELTPSVASFELILDSTCSMNGFSGLELINHQRALPIIGQTFHLRASGLLPTSLLVGGFELSSGGLWLGTGCSCQLVLTGIGTVPQFVPGTGSTRDWFLAIPNLPALLGVPIDAQGVVVDLGAPCWLMTTQAGRIVPGF